MILLFLIKILNLSDRRLKVKLHKTEKYKSPLEAIRGMCIQCMNESDSYPKIAEQCVSSECAVHDFRGGKNHTIAKK
jgi:hypothetical protein